MIIFFMKISIQLSVEKSDVFSYTGRMKKKAKLEKLQKLALTTMTLLLLASCSVEKETTARELRNHKNAKATYDALVQEKKAQRKAIEAYLDSFSEAGSVAQLFLVNIVGDKTYVPVETERDVSGSSGKDTPLVPGGCLFFSYNIAKTPEEIIDFTNSISSFCSAHQVVQPYLAVDQEGGLVDRLRGVTSALPSNSRVSASLTPKEAAALYKAQAVQLHELGFTMNLAPVSEVSMKSNEQFLSGRSYGNESQIVSYSAAAISSYEKNQIGTVVKHFPGNTNTDPHTGLPEIKLSAEALNSFIIEPFSRVVRFAPSAVLMSHARTEAFDKETPACLSKFWVTDTLKTKLNYSGLVISDDIFMAALEKNGFPPEEAAVKAVAAGIDVIMLSEKRFAPTARVLLAYAAKDKSFADRLRDSEIRVIQFKIAKGILCFEGSSAKGYTVVERSAEERFGNEAQRLAKFSAAFKQGSSLHTAHFIGGALGE